MSIRINIPDHRCRAGSTIGGTVSLHGDQDIDVQHISITIQARCKTKVSRRHGNSSSTYRGRAGLIYIKQELFSGPHTLHPGHSWPFTFTLPLQCVIRGVDRFKEQHGPFNSQYGQSLPPSFVDSYSSFGAGWSAECFIRYELEASLVGSTKIFSPGDQSCTKILDFVTFRSIQSPDPQPTLKTQTIACYSLRLRPGDEGLPLTFKEKLKSMRTGNLPVAMFKVHMELPRVGVAGQPLPVFLKLDHDIERSTAPVSPIVLLKKCSLELRAFTFIQCMREEMFHDGDDQRNWDTEHQIAFVDFAEKMETAPALTKHFDLRNVMRVRVPPYARPTFSTFNIRRTYKLRLKLSVECAQKTFKAEFLTKDFVLLAKDYMPSAESNPGTSSSNAAVDMEVAPIYQETLGPAPPGYGNAKMP